MSGEKWHVKSDKEIFAAVKSSQDGLSTEDAQKRLDENGLNELKGEEGVGIIELAINQVKSPLIYILAIAAVVSVAVQHYLDAVLIFGVVVLNTVIGMVQEWRAENALKKLQKMSAPKATVVRDGETKTIEASKVVTGDILLLETGQRVAADGRVLSVEEMQVNESSLTGESKPVYKKSQRLEKEDIPVADQDNMVFMSTAVTSGRGTAVVVATGMDTQMGDIAGQVQSAKREQTPLQKRIGRLGKYLGLVAIVLAVGLFILGFFQGYELMELLLFSIAAAISAIPAGLPAVISVTLALGVQRMANKNAIVRRLPAVETLGSTTVVCSDKTGTITKNEMTVVKIWAGNEIYEVTGKGYRPEGEITKDEKKIERSDFPEELGKLFDIGCLANNSDVIERESGWGIEGTPTEGAILVASKKTGLDCDRLRDTDRIDEIPFSSEKKYMATLYPHEGKKIIYVKGAPDRMSRFCSKYLEDGQEKEITENFRKKIKEVNEEMAGQALRVLGGAFKVIEDKEKIEPVDVEEGLTFCGFWAMEDPPRPEAIEAIADAQQAGIHVVMITGDHSVTATAIARKVGITKTQKKAMTGPEVEKSSEEQIVRQAMEVGVFARVAPRHKLAIMKALKNAGQIVAMTGDGVNDAPALKGADIGVAMGASGTEVAREAADMTLTDDNFATIIHAVEEGRVIFSNLVSVSFFLVSTSSNEMLMLTVALLLGFPLPLTAIMILWINLVTDGTTNIPLGIEPRHQDVLDLPPRDPESGIFDKKLVRRIIILSMVVAAGCLGLFYYRLQTSDVIHARTLAFTTLAAFQWFQAFNARSRFMSTFKIGLATNKWLLLGVAIGILLQLGVVHTATGNKLFETTPLTFTDWVILIPVAATILVADEILKFFKLNGKLSTRGKE